MIRMTLHSVTVECETLPQALELLDRWARAGEITLPPEPAKPSKDDPLAMAADYWAGQINPDFVKKVWADTLAAAERSKVSPSVPAPAAPPKKKTRGPRDKKDCAVCGEPFTSPSPRTITCERHRMKPGQKLADIRKVYEREQTARRAKAYRAPDRAAAKGLLARPPLRPDEPSKPCAACGDKTRESELDAKGRCKDCQPIGGKA